MNDLEIHHKLKDELAQVKQELEETQRELKKARNSRGYWKCKYRKVAGIKLSTADRARLMIKSSKENGFEGLISDECVRIANEIGVNWKTVMNRWYDKTPSK